MKAKIEILGPLTPDITLTKWVESNQHLYPNHFNFSAVMEMGEMMVLAQTFDSNLNFNQSAALESIRVKWWETRDFLRSPMYPYRYMVPDNSTSGPSLKIQEVEGYMITSNFRLSDGRVLFLAHSSEPGCLVSFSMVLAPPDV